MDTIDTISAICTGIGGAIGIIRISGNKALEIGNNIWQGSQKLSDKNVRKMLLGNLKDEVGEPGLAVYMKGPHSYTGEDTVEIHCHGGNISAKTVIELSLKAGARLAEPGEFTFRSFVNGKLDLTQAEAVADIISAETNTAFHLAERQISGLLTTEICEIRNLLTDVLSECESRLDFGEEELDWQTPEALVNKSENAMLAIGNLLSTSQEGDVLRNGIRVVIAGRPNVGKSSLLNLLLGRDRAIVTNIAGTTRDTLEEAANIRNIPVQLIDTAGIREVDDLIEGIGIERSKESVQQAQVVLWLLDASIDNFDDEYQEMIKHTKNKSNIIAVWNKVDLCKQDIPKSDFPTAKISALNSEGIDELLDLFEKAVWGYPHTEEPEVAINSRHQQLLEESLNSIPEAMTNIEMESWELSAVQIRTAIHSLGLIVGETYDLDILDNIFSRFCIGK